MSALAEVRAEARAGGCPVIDILADEEVEAAAASLIVAMVKLGWRVLPPGVALLTKEQAAGLVVAARRQMNAAQFLGSVN